jgi:hypothetical protein
MIRTLSPSLLLLAAGIASADESLPDGGEESIDMEFLEYLGSWDGAEAEWELFEAASIDAPAKDADVDQEQEEVEDSES